MSSEKDEELRRLAADLDRASRLAHIGTWELDLSNLDDVNSNVLRWSAETYRIFGYAPGGVEVTNQLFFRHVHPEDHAKVIEAVSSALRDRKPYSVEHRILRADGALRHLNEYADPIYDPGTGRPLRMFGAVQDITEKKIAQEELERFNRELERKVADRTAHLEAANRDLDAFAAAASHDLRAPLRHILSYAGLLEKRVADEEALAWVERIRAVAGDMSALMERFLEFARSGKTELRRGPVDLAALVPGLLDQLGREAGGRGIDWVVGKLPTVDGDPALLRQVLLNLLSNAVKFTATRQRARIEIGSEPAERDWVVFVRDNGVGFAPQDAERLFTPFTRLHGEFEGTGMGLANVRRIIERHGGRIWAKGTDQGATFWFALPRSSPPASGAG